MEIENLNIAELHAPNRNVRKHPEQQISELCRAVKMFGQIRPVVVDEDNVVLAGNGLVEALRRLEIHNAKAYRISNLSHEQKMKLMLSDNKT